MSMDGCEYKFCSLSCDFVLVFLLLEYYSKNILSAMLDERQKDISVGSRFEGAGLLEVTRFFYIKNRSGIVFLCVTVFYIYKNNLI